MIVSIYKAQKENEVRIFTSYFLDELRLYKKENITMHIERLKIDLDEYIYLLENQGFNVSLENTQEV